MLNIIVDVGAVVATMAVGAGAATRVAEEIQSLGSNLIIVSSGRTTAGGVRGGLGGRLTVTERLWAGTNVRATEKQLPGTAHSLLMIVTVAALGDPMVYAGLLLRVTTTV
jgi:putative ABC transport system permease protein